MLKSQRGQAIFEILPAVMVFAVCVLSALVYYRVLREQQMRLEAIRNITFAKINNSGPLTSLPGQGSLSVGGSAIFEVLRSNANPFVGMNDQCFVLRAEPASQTVSAKTPWTIGSSSTLNVLVDVRAVINRKPGGGCN